MLKIAQKTDNALLVVVALAREGGATPISLERLARESGVSQGYLEEVAGLLRAAGIISGRRGNGGGYVLTRPAKEITLANVITAVEGTTWSSECIGERGTAARRQNAAVWRKVQGQVMHALHGTTVADVIAERSAKTV